MATKEELLREIDIVTTFSQKYNMKNPAQAGKFVAFFRQKNVFKTQIGIQYIQRLNQVGDGKTEEVCFICKKNRSHDGVLCDDCMNKYSKGKKHFFGDGDLGSLNSDLSGEQKNSSEKPTSKVSSDRIRAATNTVSQKAIDLAEKVQDRLQEEDVKKAKAELSSKVNAVGEKAKKFAKDNDLDGKAEIAQKKAVRLWIKFKIWWRKRKRWEQIVLVSVAVVLTICLIRSGKNDNHLSNDGNSSGSESERGFFGSLFGAGSSDGDIITTPDGHIIYVENPIDPTITSTDDASSIIEKLYPQSDGWKCVQSFESSVPNNYFWVPVGRTDDYYYDAYANLMAFDKDKLSILQKANANDINTCYGFFLMNSNSHDYVTVFVGRYGRVLKDVSSGFCRIL